MKLGFMCDIARNGLSTINELITEVQAAEKLGFDQAWMAQVFGNDAITSLSIVARETRTIKLGTAVTPSFPRHPTALAIQALTASAVSRGRFELGLGLSHKLVIEDMYGIPYERPAAHMREYLSVLMPLLRGEACDYHGELFNVNARMTVPQAEAVTTIVAALGPNMLEVAGTLADGTITWMTGPGTLERHTIPLIRHAAAAAGRPPPRIVASLPIALCRDLDLARQVMNKKLAVYAHIPSYKNMLDREGVSNPADIALIGDESLLRERLQQLRSIGVTDFVAFCIAVDDDAAARTMAFLAREKPALAN